MAQTYLTHDMIAKEALMQLKNNLVAGSLVHNGYESEFNEKPGGWHKGNTINIKAPVYFRVKDGEVIDVVDLKEQQTTLTVDQRKHVAWRCSSQDLTLNIDAFSQRYIAPAMQALANYIDVDILGYMYKYMPNQVGNPGTYVKDLLTFNLAAARMTDEACPMDSRYCIIDPTTQAYIADHLKGLFNPGMTGPAVTRNRLPSIAGLDMYQSNNLPTHTCGTGAGTTLAVDDAGIEEGDTTITVDNSAGDIAVAFAAGDIFTVNSVFACNPISGASRNYLRQFVITDAAADAGTETALTCIPGTAPWNIYSESAAEKDLPYQNVYGLPANDDTVICAGSASLVHKVNLAFHRDLLTFAMVPLAMPVDGTKSSQASEDGFSLRTAMFWDGINDVNYIRIDALWGRKVINPFLGCRIASG